MRVIDGDGTRRLDGAEVAAWAAQYGDIALDLGAGDGRFARRLADSCPATGVVAVDLCAASLRSGGRRGGKGRGGSGSGSGNGSGNLLLVVADALALPPELTGLADRISVNFPWGSLLHGMLAGCPGPLDGLRLAARNEAVLVVRLNAGALAEAGFGLEEGGARAAAAVAAAGFAVRPVRPLGADDLRALPTTWAKRLAVGRDPRAVEIRATHVAAAFSGVWKRSPIGAERGGRLCPQPRRGFRLP